MKVILIAGILLAAPGADDTVLVAGRVVDPSGKPVAGAVVRIGADRPAETPNETRSDARGRFATAVPRRMLVEPSRPEAYNAPLAVAYAEGFGPAWTADLLAGDPDGPVLRLVPDDVPIEGRIVDLEGRPAAGLAVRPIQVNEPSEGLAEWLEKTRNARETDYYGGFEVLPRPIGETFASAAQPTVTTDADGRFRMAGFGRDRIVTLLVEGPGVATHVVCVATHPGEAESIVHRNAPLGRRRATTLHPSTFETAAPPSRAIEGVVREADTQAPEAGARIYLNLLDWRNGDRMPHILMDWGRASLLTTDAEGRYRLSGMPCRDVVALSIEPAPGRPLLPSVRALANPPSPEPTRADFELARGVAVRGRVADRETGRPVAARLTYSPTVDNPAEGAVAALSQASTDAEGRFAIAALPGPGVIVVTADDDGYLEVPLAAKGGPAPAFPKAAGLTGPWGWQAFAAIEPREGRDEVVDFALTPGPTPTVSIVDPEGRPLAGAIPSGIGTNDVGREGWWRARESAEFVVRGMNRRRIRVVVFHHRERKLAGSIAVRDGVAGPLVVRLAPWASATGRLIDAEGKPRAGVTIACRRDTTAYFATPIPGATTTDADGRFAFEGLAPGRDYLIVETETPGPLPGSPKPVGRPFQAGAGESNQLGDVGP